VKQRKRGMGMSSVPMRMIALMCWNTILWPWRCIDTEREKIAECSLISEICKPVIGCHLTALQRLGGESCLEKLLITGCKQRMGGPDHRGKSPAYISCCISKNLQRAICRAVDHNKTPGGLNVKSHLSCALGWGAEGHS